MGKFEHKLYSQKCNNEKLIKQIKCGNIALFLLRAQMFLVHMPNVLVIVIIKIIFVGEKNNVNREHLKIVE